MPTVCEQRVTAMSVPDLHNIITDRCLSACTLQEKATSRSDTLAIGRPGDCGHSRFVAVIDQETFACCGNPDLHSGIVRARSNVFPIRRPGQAKYGLRMTGIGDQGCATRSWSGAS